MVELFFRNFFQIIIILNHKLLFFKKCIYFKKSHFSLKKVSKLFFFFVIFFLFSDESVYLVDTTELHHRKTSNETWNTSLHLDFLIRFSVLFNLAGKQTHSAVFLFWTENIWNRNMNLFWARVVGRHYFGNVLCKWNLKV